ncbi:hypothetical protein JM83_3834 [Gillisia sp. Hel_I_86]|uniref:hypothetical protein n=1 Tax=Gillisia sp. Hel_I_86 TaxID=1249981 RepID=UPI001199F6E0|nr:hypothetical protein [Gillisia sp. Hel_I_86]TVZ28690.1 hypothetical protein JM83_3834 [Gillisia sp. Hel_I_86]
MKTLEYYKAILKKVEFDEILLKKELEKAIRHTTCSQQPELLQWCKEELGFKFGNIASIYMEAKNCALPNPKNINPG